MTAKRIIAGVMLAFVAASVVFLVVREVRERSAPSAPAQAAKLGPRADAAAVGDGKRLLAYYFHRTKRCTTCNTIETWTQETLQADFAAELQAGRITWKEVNFEQPEGTPYREQFDLHTQCVLLAESVDGTITEWDTLPDVWQLVQDRPAFEDYVRNEIRAWLEGS